MIRDLLLAHLAEADAGTSITSLLAAIDSPRDAETAYATEVLLGYSPELLFGNGEWTLTKVGRASTILAAIENYSVSTGRKIFRLSSALQTLPAHEHPTESELHQALATSRGRFDLLPNAMIKRND